jgi:hypothetical protein
MGLFPSKDGTIVLKNVFLKGEPGTKCSIKIFQKFFRPKIKVFGPVQIPKKNYFSISLGSLHRY